MFRDRYRDTACKNVAVNRQGATRRHRGSPVFADGHIYLSAFDGMVSVVRAGRTFELVAQNKIAGPLSASPVIVEGVIYLRTAEALYAVSAAR